MGRRGEFAAHARVERLLEAHALLARVAGELGPGLGLQGVLETALQSMAKLVPFRGGSIQLIDEGGVYVAAASPIPPSPDVLAARVPIGTGLSGRVVATGQPVVSNDVGLDPRVDPTLRSLGTNAEIKSYLAVPMVCFGEVVGVMQVDAAETDAFDDDDRVLLAGLAVQVAAAIESARRYDAVVELERLKTQFVARVSHEVRTPLTVIDGFVTTMLTHGDGLDVDDRRRMLERCRVATARLSGLVDDLLALGRVENGNITARWEPTPVYRVLDAVRAAATAPERVEFALDGDPSVTTDPALLQRALGYLVDNALKYGGGDRVALEVFAAPDLVAIAVRDQGPGVPEDTRTTFFQLFTRGAHAGPIPGLGLGLPMARTLVGLLGGDLTLESAGGGGTVARVTLSVR
ncbi:MAG: sensor histidine kinase [Acidimicrobiales bacterium]